MYVYGWEEGIFVFYFFGLARACGFSVPCPGVESAPPAWKHGVLTTEPPGKSNVSLFCNDYWLMDSGLMQFLKYLISKYI